MFDFFQLKVALQVRVNHGDSSIDGEFNVSVLRIKHAASHN
jgi:hypothetical protein